MIKYCREYLQEYMFNKIILDQLILVGSFFGSIYIMFGSILRGGMGLNGFYDGCI